MDRWGWGWYGLAGELGLQLLNQKEPEEVLQPEQRAVFYEGQLTCAPCGGPREKRNDWAVVLPEK